MAEKSSFFNSISGDRRYKAEDWAEYFAAFVSNGVLLRAAGTLAVTALAGSMGVTLAAGAAMINGYRYENTAALTLAIGTAHASLGRIDAVMLRWSRATRSVYACVVQGTAAATPAAPTPTRNADTYELCLATVLVPAGVTSITQSRITDKRLSSAVCGVATMIGELDTSTLYAQIQAALAEFQTGAMAEFADWFATIQGILSTDEAGNLLALIDANTLAIEDNASSIAALAAQMKSGARLEIQYGAVTVSAAAAGTTEYSFNFNNPFSKVPLVFPAVITSAPQSRSVSPLSRSATGTTISVYNALSAASITVWWIAIA